MTSTSALVKDPTLRRAVPSHKGSGKQFHGWEVSHQATPKREEYHLTAKDGNLQSKTMLLNGVPLELGDDGSVPAMNPVLVVVDSPLYLAPTSIAFVVLPKFEAKACS